MNSNQKPTAKTYRRSLAAANDKFGWSEVPDCPMWVFARILGEREQAHPEAAVPTVEDRALPYVRFFFGDHLGDTGHLTAQQQGIYILLIANYCVMGKPLPTDIHTLYRMVRAMTASEQQDVVIVLDQFFKVEDGVYHHKRIDKELEWSNARHERAVAANRTRWDAKADSSESEPPPPPSPRAPQPPPPPSANAHPNGDPNGHPNQNQTDRQTKQARSENENVSQAGQSVSILSDEGLSYVGASAPTTPCMTNKERWLAFITDKKADLVGTMKHAWPDDEEMKAVLAQLDAIIISNETLKYGITKAEFLAQSINDWEEEQSPPISGLKFHRWRKWLETGDPNA